jgi:hypothetical protein
VVVLALLVAALRDGDVALAHQPLVMNGAAADRGSALRIPDADVAWAVFGTLPAGGTQYLTFTRPASGMFRARALVQTARANPQLNPWLVLLGPGLERPPGLEGMLQDGEGALVLAPPDPRPVEPFQATPLPVLVGTSVELALPADGPYYLLIFDPSGQAGAYVIDTGYLQD